MRRGYPGSADLIRDEARWRSYIRDALVEPSIEIDVLARARVDKPALLRRLFELGCNYSGQIVSLDNVSVPRQLTPASRIAKPVIAKGQKEREVPLPADVFGELARYLVSRGLNADPEDMGT